MWATLRVLEARQWRGDGADAPRAQRLRIALAVPALLAHLPPRAGHPRRRAAGASTSRPSAATRSPTTRSKILDGLPADVRIIALPALAGPAQPDHRQPAAPGGAPHSRRVQRRSCVDVNRQPGAGARVRGRLLRRAGRRERRPPARVLEPARGDADGGAPPGDAPAAEDRRLGRRARRGALDETARRRAATRPPASLLEQEYYEVRPVSLIGDEVPPEVAVLVIAGPDKDFLPEELAALDRYLQRPGQALVMLDPLRAPELAAFLAPLRRRRCRPTSWSIPAARLYGGEYLTMQVAMRARRASDPRPARRAAALLAHPLGRAHGRRAGADRRRSPSCAPARRAGRTTRLRASSAPGPPRSSPAATGRARSRVGIELAFRVARRRRAPQPQQGRLVVYGNSEFANNFFIEFLGNKDLFVNTRQLARARAGRRSPAARARRQLGLQQFYLSEEQGDDAVLGARPWSQPALFALIGLFAGLAPAAELRARHALAAGDRPLRRRGRARRPSTGSSSGTATALADGATGRRPFLSRRGVATCARCASAARRAHGGVAAGTASGWVVVEPAGGVVPSDLIAAFTNALTGAEEIERIAERPRTTPGSTGSTSAPRGSRSCRRAASRSSSSLGGTNPTGTAVYARRDAAPRGRPHRTEHPLLRGPDLPGAPGRPRPDDGARGAGRRVTPSMLTADATPR